MFSMCKFYMDFSFWYTEWKGGNVKIQSLATPEKHNLNSPGPTLLPEAHASQQMGLALCTGGQEPRAPSDLPGFSSLGQPESCLTSLPELIFRAWLGHTPSGVGSWVLVLERICCEFNGYFLHVFSTIMLKKGVFSFGCLLSLSGHLRNHIAPWKFVLVWQ